MCILSMHTEFHPIFNFEFVFLLRLSERSFKSYEFRKKTLQNSLLLNSLSLSLSLFLSNIDKLSIFQALVKNLFLTKIKNCANIAKMAIVFKVS